MKKLFTNANQSKVLELECFLQKNQYFSRDSLPGIADSCMFTIFDQQRPEKSKYPSLFHWFAIIKQFAPHAIRSWRIESPQDPYYVELLEEFKKYYQPHSPLNFSEGKTSPAKKQTIGDLQFDYTMNIKFKKADKDMMNALRKKIEMKNEISSHEIINDEMRIIFRCESSKVEEIKNLVSGYPEVSTSETRKDKSKKIPRSRTFCQGQN